MNPCAFKIGDWMQSKFTGKVYQLHKLTTSGMAVLINEHGGKEDWNACNNPHFLKFTGQLKLFL